MKRKNNWGRILASRTRGSRAQTFRRNVLAWYRTRGRTFAWRDPRASTYVQLVSEVLLQRTRAETVQGMISDFIRQYPDWGALANASIDELGRSLRRIGLWRRRARSLKQLSKELVQRGGRWPEEREAIESIPAAGQYVASAVLLFVHDRAEPLLDVNMARVLERYFGPRQLADIRYDPYLQALARLVLDGVDAREVNWAILDFAAIVCTARNPGCWTCPTRKTCATGRVLGAVTRQRGRTRSARGRAGPSLE